MKITVLGAGYVGLITAVCFAKANHDVSCIDVIQEKVMQLRKGIPTIHEDNLELLLKETINSKKLQIFNTLTETTEADVIFICVGTPQAENGAANLDYIYQAALDIGNHIQKYTVIVDKSTVPVGTSKQVQKIISKAIIARKREIEFDVVSNPEFLREGLAIKDFTYPNRVVIGTTSETAANIMKELYLPFVKSSDLILLMKPQEAEMVKYAANAFLATKISFINEIAQLCDKLDVNVEQVRHGMSFDDRISPKYLNPGCGFGGSCFPKDVKALIHMGDTYSMNPVLLRAVDTRNKIQKELLFNMLVGEIATDGNLKGKVFTVWGLAFKPDTDDMREAPSINFIRAAIDAGARIQAYDPIAGENATKIFMQDITSGNLEIYDDKVNALKNSDALIVLTEWSEFKEIDAQTIKLHLCGNLILDGRNTLNATLFKKEGFEYRGIGRR